MLSRRDLLLYAAAVLTWGSTWIMINYQLGVVPAEVSLLYRYVIAAALLMGWCLMAGRSLRLSREGHLYAAALGVLLFSINYLMAYRAQLYITSAFNALAFSSMVWMNILNSRLFFRTPFQPVMLVGAALGMLGIGLMFWPQIETLTLTDQTIVGGLYCVGGALVASFGNMVSQKAQARSIPVMGSTAWAMTYGCVFLFIFALLQDKPFVIDTRPSYIASLLYLAVIGSIVGFLCYLSLLGSIGAARAGYVVVMFPVVAIVLSMLFEGLRPTPIMWLGMALILIGNGLILVRRGAKANAPSIAVRRPA